MLSLLPFLLIGIPVALVMMWLTAKMEAICIADPSLLLCTMVLVFSLALVPGTGALIAAQCLVFPFTVKIDAQGLRYQLSNGVKRCSLTLPMQGCLISVCPVYSHGDWGYAIHLRRSKRGLSWPLLPAAIIGPK